jgi:hypothetical protein
MSTKYCAGAWAFDYLAQVSRIATFQLKRSEEFGALLQRRMTDEALYSPIGCWFAHSDNRPGGKFGDRTTPVANNYGVPKRVGHGKDSAKHRQFQIIPALQVQKLDHSFR